MCCCLFSTGDAADSSALLVDRSRSPRGPRVADWTQCEWGEQLGAGAFAQVWAVRLPPFGDVAAKVLREDQRGDRAAASDIAREASLVCRLCHPHVLHGLLAHDHPAHGTVLVLPRIACTLAQHFRPPTQRTPCDDWRLARDWPLRRVLLVGLQLASALDYLHEHALAEHHVLHRDLKPDNVGLLGERGPRGVPCLLDFGCARMAPEVYEGRPYGRRSESHSFALLLWHLLAREPPFEALIGLGGKRAFEEEVVQGGVRPRLFPEWPVELAALLDECWQPAPHRRPRMAQLATPLVSAAEVQVMARPPSDAPPGVS
ncbi:hypothetical protein EMIHUDRAFT_453272 [Emiliania huxleyi CCMP1516]|uniref:Protein kinase domain-containing protein n=2 Tax=Emiliania huxleyi TaxID=2903 RepID=A0A0D3I8U5_EMIH1|nr:hypothetical protein EMIHUDRAFT_453272 [Emiliania huxleyi CCMP1516]EOD07680.1 hypothetical protein EMIHUDRAFT_453272 [Emiliania huxleyi CCMP1516]|eukprot:XP_005760109.1 hypothetical protein EMIHUDRAFT_453272 [Emiliania huxleyi CCMP1516]